MEGSTSNNQEYEEHEMTADSIFGSFTNTPARVGNEFAALRSPMSVSFTPNFKSNDPLAPSPFPIITENIFILHSNFASPSLPFGMGNSK